MGKESQRKERIMTKQEELRYLTLPLMNWLEENHHPHITVMVTSTQAEVLEGKYNVFKEGVTNDTQN